MNTLKVMMLLGVFMTGLLSLQGCSSMMGGDSMMDDDMHSDEMQGDDMKDDDMMDDDTM